jgi:phage terminase small subunit
MPALSNPRHERFAQGLAKGLSADEAYQEAGFTANRGNASRLKANESVEARVREILGKAEERAEIDIARTLKELVRLGTSDIRKAFDENGRLKRPEDWDDDTAAAIAGIEVVSRSLGKDEEGRTEIEHVHKIKFWDKNSALDKIAKHLGMFIERVEHTGKDGGPLVPVLNVVIGKPGSGSSSEAG